MKFKRGQTKIVVPPMGSLESATLMAEGMAVVLAIVHMDDIAKMRKRANQEQSWPMYAALAVGAHEVHVWPTPHKGGDLKLQYYPPMQEI